MMLIVIGSSFHVVNFLVFQVFISTHFLTGTASNICLITLLGFTLFKFSFSFLNHALRSRLVCNAAS